MRRLVIMRPQPGATATATAARAMGLVTIVIPLFATEAIKWEPPDPAKFDAILLTSANAIRHGGAELDRLRHIVVDCVGEATAAAAREAGFKVDCVGCGGIDALLETLSPELRLLHLCGADRRQPQAAKQAIIPVPVYRAVELDARNALRTIEGAVVAVHSPRAATRLSALADELDLNRDTIEIAAISGEAAGAAGPGWRSVEVATEPSDPALLALASRLCNKPG